MKTPGPCGRAPLWLGAALLGVAGCHAIARYSHTSSDGARVDALRTDAVRADGPARDDASRDGAAAWHSVVALDPQRDGCPAPWLLRDGVGCTIERPACDVPTVAAVLFPVGRSYREVRGRLRAIQYFSTDAFHAGASSIEAAYVDGVSITCGAPRQHLWTYAAALSAVARSTNGCPCLSAEPPPAFVGEHYYCDTGNPGPEYERVFYSDDPLFDGESLLPASCPSGGPQGEFVRELAAPSSAPLEVRIMFDQCDENLALTSLELWVR